MNVRYDYYINNAQSVLENKYPKELKDTISVISGINSSACRVKVSQEKGRKGKLLYSPTQLNGSFKNILSNSGWHPYKIKIFSRLKGNILSGEREIDFFKNSVGTEIQFGKYAFMLNDIFGKLQLFYDRNVIDVGICIVPTAQFALNMSTGVSTFEYLYSTLENINICPNLPIAVFGIE